jgi:hypothetical protein
LTIQEASGDHTRITNFQGYSGEGKSIWEGLQEGYVQDSQPDITAPETDITEVTQSSDSPGFIANAILMPMLNEAILVLEKVSQIFLPTFRPKLTM